MLKCVYCIALVYLQEFYTGRLQLPRPRMGTGAVMCPDLFANFSHLIT